MQVMAIFKVVHCNLPMHVCKRGLMKLGRDRRQVFSLAWEKTAAGCKTQGLLQWPLLRKI